MTISRFIHVAANDLFHSFYAWVMFHCTCVLSYLLHPFLHGWIVRLLPCPQFSSVQFSRSIMSNSLRPHELPHIRLEYPTPTPGACTNSCPLSQWCYPTICCPLLLPPSIFPSIMVFSNESLLCIRWPKYWSFSFSVILPMNIQDWFSLELTGRSSAVQETLKILFQHHSSKASIFQFSAFFIVPLSHPYMTTGKTIALTRWTLFLSMLSRLA